MPSPPPPSAPPALSPPSSLPSSPASNESNVQLQTGGSSQALTTGDDGDGHVLASVAIGAGVGGALFALVTAFVCIKWCKRRRGSRAHKGGVKEVAIVNPLAVTTIGSTYVNPAPLSTMSHDQPLPSMKMANGELIGAEENKDRI